MADEKSSDEKILDFLWYDHKKHTVTLSNGSEDIDIEQIRETYKKVIEEKKEQCEGIYYLGAGLCGSPESAHGFMLGWLVKSIRDDLVKKEGNRIVINHDKRDVSDEEAKIDLVKKLREFADDIESSEKAIKKVPMIRGDVDGGELF
jgi:hypothetical protein